MRTDLRQNMDKSQLPVKKPVDGNCPECGAADLRQYPVLAVGGWFEVVKCQQCLFSVSRTPWHRLGWVNLAEDAEGAI